MAFDLDKDKAQVHIKRASTGLCAAHWVDMAALTTGPEGAKPCACHTAPQAGGEDDHHAA
jgi:hypothetical protein